MSFTADFKLTPRWRKLIFLCMHPICIWDLIAPISRVMSSRKGSTLPSSRMRPRPTSSFLFYSYHSGVYRQAFTGFLEPPEVIPFYRLVCISRSLHAFPLPRKTTPFRGEISSGSWTVRISHSWNSVPIPFTIANLPLPIKPYIFSVFLCSVSHN